MRILAIVGLLLYSGYLLLAFVEWTVGPEAHAALAWSYAGAPAFVYHPTVFGAFFGVRLVATVGLLLRADWGRQLFAVWLAAAIAHTAISGVMVSPALDAALAYLSSVVDGAILALAYRQRRTPTA
jgi:hypothetical protein